jgi:hypothetical protein
MDVLNLSHGGGSWCWGGLLVRFQLLAMMVGFEQGLNQLDFSQVLSAGDLHVNTRVVWLNPFMSALSTPM